MHKGSAARASAKPGVLRRHPKTEAPCAISNEGCVNGAPKPIEIVVCAGPVLKQNVRRRSFRVFSQVEPLRGEIAWRFASSSIQGRLEETYPEL